jgi:hypothetical protein
VVKFPRIAQISLGSGSETDTIKGGERREKGCPSVIGVPAIDNQILRDVSLSGLTISAKIKWDKNKDVGPVLGQAP